MENDGDDHNLVLNDTTSTTATAVNVNINDENNDDDDDDNNSNMKNVLRLYDDEIPLTRWEMDKNLNNDDQEESSFVQSDIINDNNNHPQQKLQSALRISVKKNDDGDYDDLGVQAFISDPSDNNVSSIGGSGGSSFQMKHHADGKVRQRSPKGRPHLKTNDDDGDDDDKMIKVKCVQDVWGKGSPPLNNKNQHQIHNSMLKTVQFV